MLMVVAAVLYVVDGELLPIMRVISCLLLYNKPFQKVMF